MSSISETDLRGLGRKFQIETFSGDRLVIVIHDDGDREVYHFDGNDLEVPASVTTLTDGEARQVAGIVGGLTYVPKSMPTAELVLDDLVLDWFVIKSGSFAIGKTIQDLHSRRATGASIISLVEPEHANRINPGAGTVLNEGATLVLAGDRQTISAMKSLLINGSV